MTGQTTQHESRVRWRCRRGMKELDVVLERYFDRRYRTADVDERQAFDRLLELQDPVIYGYVMGREQPTDPKLRFIVDWLRRPV